MAISTETKTRWNEKLNAIISAYDNGKIILTDYEISFIDNVEKMLSCNYEITMNQSKYLNSIYWRIS